MIGGAARAGSCSCMDFRAGRGACGGLRPKVAVARRFTLDLRSELRVLRRIEGENPMRHLLLAGLAAATLAAPALASPLTISASIGGAPTGVARENFNALPFSGSPADTTTATGIAIDFMGTGNGQGRTAQLPNVGGRYAAPFLSGGNGAGFGAGGTDQANGPNATIYLSVGTGGTIALTLPSPQRYFGLLWGSIDTYNFLDFYSGNTLLGTVTGTMAAAAANTLPNGNQAGQGTAYVNVTSTDAFDRVVARSTGFAFEFDNVAFNPRIPGGDPTEVPVPAALGLFGLGLAGLLAARRRRG
jgi:hypothetical protein